MLRDFHTHTTYSDGSLTLDELVEVAERRGYVALAVTDHAREGSHLELAATVSEHVRRLSGQTGLRLLAGVELTEFSPDRIDQAALEVRQAGAQIVVVHGECMMFDVAPGTNAAAARSNHVDILAHPGNLSVLDGMAAAQHGVHLELSARPGHCYANGLVFSIARRAGARVIVDSDAHAEIDLLSARKVSAVVRGAGAPDSMLDGLVETAARLVTRRAPQPIVVPA